MGGLSKNLRKIIDVIVVGGGPAGTATAIVCSTHGLRTVLLEADSEAGERPGETLHPGIEPLLRSLGIDNQVNQSSFLRHPGYLVRSGSNSSFQAYRSDRGVQWFGYQAERKRLRCILLERALASGVAVSLGERAIRPVLCGDTVSGLVTTAQTYASRFVIDATGSSQWLRRQLRIGCFRVSTLLVAYYGWVEPSRKLERSHILPEFRMGGGGWSWTAPIKPGKFAWVSLNLSDKRSSRMIVPAILAHSTPIGRLGARDVTWKIARPCAGPGYFLVGDAACVLDPASSHGVLMALMSGMIVAESIVQTLSGRANVDRLQKGYCRWTEDRFCSDAQALISLYSDMESRPSWLSAASEAVRYIATNPSVRAFSIRLTNM